MCGRFYIEKDLENIAGEYEIKCVKEVSTAHGEIFPGSNIPIIYQDKQTNMDFFRWGFQINKTKKEVINARIETILEKPAFREAILDRRCIIPANAFFEWKASEKGKQKYKIEVSNKALFFMAGIYGFFLDENNRQYTGVAILTCAANEQMAKIHHRMPVILHDERKWLQGSSKEILSILKEEESGKDIQFRFTLEEKAQQISMYDLM